MRMKKRIYLILHCEAEGLAFRSKLTSEGRTAAQKLSDFLYDKDVDLIVSSPFIRACETAMHVSERLQLKMIKDIRLSEKVLCTENAEDWLTMVEKSFSDLDLTFPGGESSNEAMKRGVIALQDTLLHTGKSAAIITHSNLLILILKHFQKEFGYQHWKALTSPDVYTLEFLSEKPEICRMWN